MDTQNYMHLPRGYTENWIDHIALSALHNIYAGVLSQIQEGFEVLSNPATNNVLVVGLLQFENIIQKGSQ